MSGFILAFIIAPIAVVGVGYLAVRLNERAVERDKASHVPAE
ncbi:hypothetical protein PE067_08730 [Paracoccus sp. DMF-8]|nr:hypothetical protein [Paracoccus sp. DMF-8]MDF3606208.1 hypothetical protein [Paracoccus sp. DMF-8]